jgi:putative acetyltransferase
MLRAYSAANEDAAIELWRRTWQAAYPQIDFSARLAWWRERWRTELVPTTEIVIAESGDEIAGFVTVDPKTGYLDQIVVAPEFWGSGAASVLLAEAMRISPLRLDIRVNQDNARAIHFYKKNGFVIIGEDTNPNSGAPLYKMNWQKS